MIRGKTRPAASSSSTRGRRPISKRGARLVASAISKGAGVATEWAPQTRDAVAKAYGRWLGWLARRGLLEPDIGPADRLERSVVARYVADLQASVAPNTVVMYVSYLAMALRAMVPSNDHGWLREAAIRLKAVATPVRRKRHLLGPRRICSAMAAR